MATIRVRVVPNAKVNDVVGEHGEAIKIKLRAPAIEGKANAALIVFLSERLRISTRHVALLKGHKSRDKVIRIDGVTQDQLRERLLRTS
jgi:uncharacterized protein